MSHNIDDWSPIPEAEFKALKERFAEKFKVSTKDRRWFPDGKGRFIEVSHLPVKEEGND